MSTATVLIDKIAESSGTAKSGKPWTKWAIKDANGEYYSTFSRDVLNGAKEGDRVEIDFDVDGKFKNLTAVRPVEAEPKLGDGSYVKGRENPDTQRSISASVALQQAVATMAHTIGTSVTPKAASERVLPLAAEYFRWLIQRAGLESDEDIPF